MTAPDEEDLDVGRRRLPRWAAALVVGLAGAVVAAGVVALVVRGGGSPDPAPSTAAVHGSGVDALVADHRTGRYYRLEGGRLLAGATGRAAVRSEPVAPRPSVTALLRLVDDETGGLVWVVPTGGTTPGTAQAYDARTLRRVRSVELPAVVTATAALDGRLWVGDAASVLRLDPRASGFVRTGLPPALALVADPGRARVLGVFPGSGLTLGALGAGQGLAGSAPLPPGTAALAVAGTTVWVLGQDLRGALVAPVFPTTLRTGTAVRAVRDLGDVSELVGAGDRSLFVRSGPGAATVVCLDGSGARKQTFPGLRGTVVATHGSAYVVDLTGPARRLRLAGCPG